MDACKLVAKGYDKAIKECEEKLDELECMYSDIYGAKIIEMYADIYMDFREWLKGEKL